MTTMRNILYILTIYASLSSCSNKTENVSSRQNALDTLPNPNSLIKTITDCDFIYDTIRNEKYNMHLSILDKYYHKGKRGYFFTPNGDTLNHFLYHQDIAAFAYKLDSTEQGIYKKLTNKVVFLILEHEPKMLDCGLALYTQDIKRLDYFMYHVSHPTCNTVSVDSIISLIKTEMHVPHEAAKKVKQLLMENLERGKQNTMPH